MAKRKFEKEKVREKLKKDARRREEARRASTRTIKNAIHSVFEGTATVSELAQILNAKARPPAAHPSDDELATQVAELRKEVDNYLAAFEGAMAIGARSWTLIPGIIVGLFPVTRARSPGGSHEIETEPCPLALSCSGPLTFEPVEAYLRKQPQASAATWFITSNRDAGLNGLLCLALSANRNGARSIHAIRNGRWARLHGVESVEPIFVATLRKTIEDGHPDGVLLAVAARLDSAVRGHASIDDALGEIQGVPADVLQARMNPQLEHLRRGLLGYHRELMSLVDRIAVLERLHEADLAAMRKVVDESEARSTQHATRANALERELARAKTQMERQNQSLMTMSHRTATAAAPALPLRDRLAEIFK